MKVKELIENLKKLDPEAICVYSGDDEGNYFGEIYFTPSEGLYNEEIREDEEGYVFEGKKAVCIN